MSRRVICAFVFGVLSVVVLGAGVPAGAAPVGVEEKQVEIGEAQDRLQKIQTEASVSYENYDSALLGLNALDEKIEGSKRDLSQAENRMTEAQKSLEETAAQVYKSGNVGFIDVLVGSKDFDEFASRLELWVRLLAEERDRFEVVRDARDELQAEQAQLQEQRDDRVAALETALEEREQAESAASEAEEYLQSLSGDLQAEIEAAAARRAEEAQAAAEAALKDVEPAPAPKMVQVAQVAPDTSRADLRAEREAAEQRAAERAEKRAAAEAAAEEAERQAELAAKEAAKDEAAQQEAAQRRAEERRAEAAAARRAAEEAAVEQAAADRAAELAAQREAEQAAAEQAAAEQAAAEQAAAEQAAAEQAAVETTTPDNTVPETTPPAPESAPAPATGGGSCGDTFGGVQPNVAEVGCLIRAQFGIQTIYGVRPGDPGDHGTGRALDIMTYSDVDTAYQVADYLLANMGQFGISYVITQQQINFGSGWEPMEDRGDPTQNHMDHVHVSFY